MAVKRQSKSIPPLVIHIHYRRIYGDSAYLRSTNRRRLRKCAAVRAFAPTTKEPTHD